MDHILIHDDKHLELVIKEYTSYFNQERIHQGIGLLIPEEQDQCQQVDGSHRRQFLLDCTIAIFVLYPVSFSLKL
jgi:hypothetical protein